MERLPLPIDEWTDDIVESLWLAGALVVTASAGAGKSTRLPPAIARRLGDKGGQVWVLQPRRVAARATAARMAEEWGCELGTDVGYHIRFERRATARSRVVVVTEGLLLRRLQDDPFLEGVSCVILDEFHERSLHTDLAIAWIREIRRDVRPDLMALVMSASLDAAPVAAFLGCGIREVPGRVYPTAVEYAPQSVPASRCAAAAAEAVAVALERLTATSDDGHILVFLPGVREIGQTQRILEKRCIGTNLEMLPLHGALTFGEQQRALSPSEGRKCVLATNIAETSLTVEGLAVVVDSGWERRAEFDPARGFDRLHTRRISGASATQRAGRVGRTRAGLVMRLWSEWDHQRLSPATLPEIRRVDLTRAALEIRVWSGRQPADFALFEAPEPNAWARADDELLLAGAVSPSGQIEPFGRALLRLPLPPRWAAWAIRGAQIGLGRAACALATWVTEGSPALQRVAGADPSWSEIIRLMDAGNDRFGARSESGSRLARLRRTHSQLLRLACAAAGSGDPPRKLPSTATATATAIATGADTETALIELALHVWPDRVARVREGGDGREVLLGSGTGARLESPRVPGSDCVVLDVGGGRWAESETAVLPRASASAPLLEEWWKGRQSSALATTRRIFLDDRRLHVVCEETTHWGAIVLRRHRSPAEPGLEVAQLLVKQMCPDEQPLSWAWVLERPRLKGWVSRWCWLQAAEGMGSTAAAGLAAPLLRAVERGALATHRVRDVADELARGVPWSIWSPAEIARLAREAPESIALPSGRTVALRYEGSGQPPVVSAALQEFFGWQESPRIAGGRVPLQLELLAPSGRPAQRTSDLADFWTGSYEAVRRELRGRYPKHYWPEDPRTASYRRPGRGKGSLEG